MKTKSSQLMTVKSVVQLEPFREHLSIKTLLRDTET